MKKFLSILLSAIVCVSAASFSDVGKCYADNNNLSDTEVPLPKPYVDEGSDDTF